MTVGDLIDKLKQFSPEMPVAINFDVFEEINVNIKIWTDSNYPNVKPDILFVSLE